MPKVTFSNAKGILQEAGTGFQVNDAPILMESETVAGNASITVDCVIVDDDASIADITGKYFLIATPDTQYYVWFDGGDATTTDPLPYGLDESVGIRISDAIGLGLAIGSNADAANAIQHRLEATDGTADGILDYSDLPGSVLGDAGEGDVDVSVASGANEFAVTDNGDGSVTIHVIPMGSVASSNMEVRDDEQLQGLAGDGTGGLDWTVELAVDGSGTGSNGSALQAFGASVIRNAGTKAVSCTLANAAAGAKKLVRQDPEDGGGTIVMTFTDHAGSTATATFGDDEDLLYLLSTGLGWAVLHNQGTVAIA